MRRQIDARPPPFFCFEDLSPGTCFRHTPGGLIYIKTELIVGKAKRYFPHKRTLNAVCLNDGTFTWVNDNIEVLPVRPAEDYTK